MADYIEREAAIRIAEKHGLTSGSTLGRHSGVADWIADELADIPAADVEPVRCGEWDEDDDDIICPLCQRHWNKCDNCTETFVYCPNCGAKLDGEDLEDDGHE